MSLTLSRIRKSRSVRRANCSDAIFVASVKIFSAVLRNGRDGEKVTPDMCASDSSTYTAKQKLYIDRALAVKFKRETFFFFINYDRQKSIFLAFRLRKNGYITFSSCSTQHFLRICRNKIQLSSVFV